MTADNRWPRWVYSQGGEPDYRFSFANERTFLAWIRTSLAMLAAAVAVDVVDLDLPQAVQHALAGLLVGLGASAAVVGWMRWASAERAIRRGEPLPSLGVALIVTIGIVATGAVAAAASL